MPVLRKASRQGLLAGVTTRETQEFSQAVASILCALCQTALPGCLSALLGSVCFSPQRSALTLAGWHRLLLCKKGNRWQSWPQGRGGVNASQLPGTAVATELKRHSHSHLACVAAGTAAVMHAVTIVWGFADGTSKIPTHLGQIWKKPTKHFYLPEVTMENQDPGLLVWSTEYFEKKKKTSFQLKVQRVET